MNLRPPFAPPGSASAADSPATTAWHAIDADAALAALRSRREGLSTADATARLQRDGPNLLPEAAPTSVLAMFARQFADFMIGVLIVAALVAAAIGEPVEAAAILAIVVLNAILGFSQEWRAEQAMAALRAMSAPRARVLRDGGRTEIPAADLVVGDVVWLEAGTKVPADLRLVDDAALRIEEAALTG
ncbi:MAG: calcium-translocating P-type ATPase, SERCA-type, partial [Burkholderiaceae bacterium]|nr:calcium-translocating P-type ATPase, SERCA-type [Burkholderiaceae bacterium]